MWQKSDGDRLVLREARSLFEEERAQALQKLEQLRADFLQHKINYAAAEPVQEIDRKAFQQMQSIKSEMRDHERDLWVLDGVLVHDLRIELLEQIRIRHQNIDCVPSGYFYSELYIDG